MKESEDVWRNRSKLSEAFGLRNHLQVKSSWSPGIWKVGRQALSGADIDMSNVDMVPCGDGISAKEVAITKEKTHLIVPII